MKILLVEDARSVVRVMTARLSSYGHDVVHAENGLLAVDMFERVSPDLVLMDIYLAGAMGGITAAKIIRILYGVPSVFLSAFAETAFTGSDNLAQAELDEPAGYLSKPYEAHELHAVIEAALKR